MKQSRNPFVLAFAAIGVCAVLYGAWYLYRRAEVKEQSRAAFTAPAPSGIPDILHATPGAPPIQPH
jgi:hypothetical protein